jgi:tRNA-splicing ligase RtcB
MANLDMLRQVSETLWELPISYMDDAVCDQVTNVVTLPGITRDALCMPDGHFGHGFPIGGVAAMDVHQGGVISPGGSGSVVRAQRLRLGGRPGTDRRVGM